MNINQNYSPSFSAIKKPASMKVDRMHSIDQVCDIVERTKEYLQASGRKIDIYFLQPTRKNEIMKVAYYDNDMGSFVRDARNRILVTSTRSVNENKPFDSYNFTERICSTLYKIIHGQFKAPYWYYDPFKYQAEYEKICKANDIV